MGSPGKKRILWIGGRGGEGGPLSKGIAPLFDLRFSEEFKGQEEVVPPHEIARRAAGAGFEADLFYFWSPNITDDYRDWEIPAGPSVAHFVDSHFSFPWQSHLTPLFQANILEVLSARHYFWRDDPSRLSWCPPSFHGTEADVRRHPPYAQREWDVAFIGSMNSQAMPHRVNFFRQLGERLKNRFAVHLGRHEGPVGSIYSRAKIVINYTTRPAWAYNPDPHNLRPHAAGLNGRVFDAMGHGAMLLADVPSDDLTALFRVGEHFAPYQVNDVDDAVRQIEYYLAHEEERLAIALAGWQEIMEKHTYPARGRHLAELLTRAMEPNSAVASSLEERRFLLGRALLRMALQTPDPDHPILRRNHEEKLEQAGLRLRQPCGSSNEHLRRSLVPLLDAVAGRPRQAVAQWFYHWDSDRCPLAATVLEIALQWLGEVELADQVCRWRAQNPDASAGLSDWDRLDLWDMFFIVFQKFPKDFVLNLPAFGLSEGPAAPAQASASAAA